MKSKHAGLNQVERQFLHEEYPVVAESWRFFTGVRFALLTFAATLLFALLGGYQYVLSNLHVLGQLGYTAKWAIPVFGIINTLAVIAIESRTRKLYGACLERGMKIEQGLGIRQGHFHSIWSAPLPFRFASHSWAVRAIYVMILTTWVYLWFKR